MLMSDRWEAAAAELEGMRDLWPDSVPREVHDEHPTFGLNDYLQKWSRERPETTAIHFYGLDVTYRHLEDAVASFAGWLVSEGVTAGDRVGVYLSNSPQFTIAFLGILRIGAVHVPINPMFKTRELLYEVDDAGVSLLLAQSDLQDVVQLAATQGCMPSKVFYTHLADMLETTPDYRMPFEPASPDRASDWAAIMGHEGVNPITCDRDALAALNYTGGTTGLPKGCEHTQGHMIYTALSSIMGMGRTPGAEGDVVLGFLPMFWIAGEDICMINPLVDGATVVLMNRWNPQQAAALIQEQGVVSMLAPADSYVELLETPEFLAADTSTLRNCTGASFVRKVDIPLRKQWRAATGGELREAAFGMTETHTLDTFTFGLSTNDQDLLSEPTYCGYPVPGTSIVVVDSDLKPCPVGEAGQILIKSPSVLTRYYNRPDATAESLVDGWLFTGDTGRFDEHGALSYLARTKEMIKVNGMSVFPAELETLFREHDSVQTVAVAPRDDDVTGQVPVAYILLSANTTTTADELVAWAKERIAGFKVPEVVLVEDMPMTATGKIRKVELVKGLNQ